MLRIALWSILKR